MSAITTTQSSYIVKQDGTIERKIQYPDGTSLIRLFDPLTQRVTDPAAKTEYSSPLEALTASFRQGMNNMRFTQYFGIEDMKNAFAKQVEDFGTSYRKQLSDISANLSVKWKDKMKKDWERVKNFFYN